MAEPVVDAASSAAQKRNLISFAPLRHRDYAWVWTGAFISNIGTWMETIALGIYVTKHTGQAAWTGTVAAAAFLPIAFLGPIGGALADRYPQTAAHDRHQLRADRPRGAPHVPVRRRAPVGAHRSR